MIIISVQEYQWEVEPVGVVTQLTRYGRIFTKFSGPNPPDPGTSESEEVDPGGEYGNKNK